MVYTVSGAQEGGRERGRERGREGESHGIVSGAQLVLLKEGYT